MPQAYIFDFTTYTFRKRAFDLILAYCKMTISDITLPSELQQSIYISSKEYGNKDWLEISNVGVFRFKRLF